jgi:hypothetical protein
MATSRQIQNTIFGPTSQHIRERSNQIAVQPSSGYLCWARAMIQKCKKKVACQMLDIVFSTMIRIECILLCS